MKITKTKGVLIMRIEIIALGLFMDRMMFVNSFNCDIA